MKMERCGLYHIMEFITHAKRPCVGESLTVLQLTVEPR